jgi:DNA primase
MAICPFHIKADGSTERRPSFAMNIYNGLWFCHSCQSSGNLYSFLKNVGVNRVQIESVYRPLINEAIRNMPPAPDPLQPKLYDANPIQEGLLGLFDYCPTALLEVGFAENTLKHFGVGFDMDYVRITYPIRDLAGNLVAISGRNVDGGYSSYKVYDEEYKTWGLPPRLNWDKRTVLWNAHDVYPRIYFQTMPDFVVVVEGFKACMWVWQAGISNVVALMGTYLSWEHRWILERMGAPVYLFLDNNDPGQRGVEKGVQTLSQSLSVKVVEYPKRLEEDVDAQPDSCTAEEVITQIKGAISHYDWLAA